MIEIQNNKGNGAADCGAILVEGSQGTDILVYPKPSALTQKELARRINQLQEGQVLRITLEVKPDADQ